jgi:hypothetical protein
MIVAEGSMDAGGTPVMTLDIRLHVVQEGKVPGRCSCGRAELAWPLSRVLMIAEVVSRYGMVRGWVPPDTLERQDV